jgi:hypothetical protein
MALVAKNFEGFEKFDSGYYETANYTEAQNKIEIEVSGGVSSISISKY